MIAGGVTDVRINKAKTDHCNSGDAGMKSKCEAAVGAYAVGHPEDENLVVVDAIGHSSYTDQWKAVKERPAEIVTKSLAALDSMKQGMKLKTFTKAGQELPVRPLDFNRGGLTGIAADTFATKVVEQIKAKAEEKDGGLSGKYSVQGDVNDQSGLAMTAALGVEYHKSKNFSLKPSVSFETGSFPAVVHENTAAFLRGSHDNMESRQYTLDFLGLTLWSEDLVSMNFGLGVMEWNAEATGFGLSSRLQIGRDTVVETDDLKDKPIREFAGKVGLTGYGMLCAVSNSLDNDQEGRGYCGQGSALGVKADASINFKRARQDTDRDRKIDNKKDEKDNSFFQSFSLGGNVSHAGLGDEAPAKKAKSVVGAGGSLALGVHLLTDLNTSVAYAYRSRTSNDDNKTEDSRNIFTLGFDISILSYLELTNKFQWYNGAPAGDYITGEVVPSVFVDDESGGVGSTNVTLGEDAFIDRHALAFTPDIFKGSTLEIGFNQGTYTNVFNPKATDDITQFFLGASGKF